MRKSSVGFVAVCAGYALAMFHRTAFSEIAPLLGAEIGLSAARLGWIGSSFFWVYLLTQIPAGLLLDAVGPRRSRPGPAPLWHWARRALHWLAVASEQLLR